MHIYLHWILLIWLSLRICLPLSLAGALSRLVLMANNNGAWKPFICRTLKCSISKQSRVNERQKIQQKYKICSKKVVGAFAENILSIYLRS